MHKIMYGIVFYGEKIESCKTNMTLLKSGVNKEHIYLYNNCKYNYKLPIIYNRFIDFAKINGFSHVVLLDHDTEINADYIQAIHRNLDYSVIIPTLSKQNIIFSPTNHGKWLRACMSGICLNMQKIKDFHFDQRFSLYGVDDFLLIYCFVNNIDIFVLKEKLIHDISTLSGFRGLNTYSNFKLRELFRGVVLNFRCSPLRLKLFFLKKIFYYGFCLLRNFQVVDFFSIIINPSKNRDYI